MKTTILHARIDAEMKIGAETILRKLGLNSADAIRLFYSQILLRRGLPFPVAIPNARTRKVIKDGLSGKNVRHFNSAEDMFATWDGE
ncbi:MAG: type II toxin-antitoxin system RelB/DinJ family antitoxin [Kiritimatiellaeota bacterium]|nr:type II toxin-antitoxin system RelB/DinJ family antitoxin [Kiritimatiellota bacterium]